MIFVTQCLKIITITARGRDLLRIKNIHDIESAYLELYRDLKFDVRDGCVTIHRKLDYISVQGIEELSNLFQALTQFSLSSNDKDIIKSRYGIDNGVCKTFNEVGKIYNYSDEYIRLKIRRSFRKILHRLNIDTVFRMWEGEIHIGGKATK